MLLLGKAAKAQLRELVIEEVQAELKRALPETFIKLVTQGNEDMGRIFDAVLECDDNHRKLTLALAIIERAVEQLRAEREPASSTG